MESIPTSSLFIILGVRSEPNQPEIGSYSSIDICWFTSKVFRNCSAILKHHLKNQSDVLWSKILQKFIFEPVYADYINHWLLRSAKFLNWREKIAEIKDGRHQTQGFWVSTISFLFIFWKIGAHLKFIGALTTVYNLTRMNCRRQKLNSFFLLNLYESLLGFLMEDNK